MKANTSSKRLLAALVALGSLWFCDEARALFTGLDDRSDESAAVAGAGSSTRSTAAQGPDSGSGEVIVNPFDDGLRSTVPEDRPGERARLSSSWTNRHRNARRFERLVQGGVKPAAEVKRVEKETAPSKPPKPGGALDYVVGVLVAAGLGVLALLLFRRHGRS